ncbi:CAP domain-containing protein [Photobacterium chitinilyticum]|uniref:CAP domain-containing protein n=1 Tax=Photobacterium chitinilyticum TaxID=2485123 RepID=A0A444JR10_9GAMM|nr:CAP domain-containing protein [Photobacterium chitinilyticum]RWX55535.1 CAP domain-containing protein [Photobacterium chitinilyticum]
MRTLSLLILSTLLVTGCGSGGGSDDGAVADSGSNSGNGTVISGDGSSDNGGTSGNNDGNSGNNGSNGEPQSGDFADQMLAAVNAARAQARDCGGQMMPAVPALTWDYSLEQAAFVHSSNMANYNFFSHTGLNGDQPSDRVSDQGYSWSSVGENIAAGQKDLATVMDSWLNSPGHCKNIMGANFTQMGAASVTNSSAQYSIYWTQVFARPR